MALEGHRTLLCAEVVDWLVLVACFRDIRGFARKREAVSAHAETSLPFSRSHAFKVGRGEHSCLFSRSHKIKNITKNARRARHGRRVRRPRGTR